MTRFYRSWLVRIPHKHKDDGMYTERPPPNSGRRHVTTINRLRPAHTTLSHTKIESITRWFGTRHANWCRITFAAVHSGATTATVSYRDCFDQFYNRMCLCVSVRVCIECVLLLTYLSVVCSCVGVLCCYVMWCVTRCDGIAFGQLDSCGCCCCFCVVLLCTKSQLCVWMRLVRVKFRTR